MAHAFISYVHEDAGRVDRLQEALEASGISVWRDISDLYPGDVWRRRLEEAIRVGAAAFVPCFSEASQARRRSTMFEELMWAAEEYRRRNPDRSWIFPVLFDEVRPTEVDLGGGRTLEYLHCR